MNSSGGNNRAGESFLSTYAFLRFLVTLCSSYLMCCLVNLILHVYVFGMHILNAYLMHKDAMYACHIFVCSWVWTNIVGNCWMESIQCFLVPLLHIWQLRSCIAHEIIYVQREYMLTISYLWLPWQIKHPWSSRRTQFNKSLLYAHIACVTC